MAILKENKNISKDNLLSKIDDDIQDIQMQTFHYKFADNVIELLSYFAKLHQFDNRITFKEAWKEWIQEESVSIILNDEIKRLSNMGYKGDILDKMFKSTRYYYRKKKDTETIKKDRKKYIRFSENMLNMMDNHIMEQLQKHIKREPQKNTEDEIGIIHISPCDAYFHFCETNKEHIEDEIKQIIHLHIEKNELSNKFKKTYKNRYFNITKKISSSPFEEKI
jgi:hypothetical protein